MTGLAWKLGGAQTWEKDKQALYVYLHPSFSGKLFLSFVVVGLPNHTGPSEKFH